MLRLSGFALMPLLVVAHPGFGAASYLAVIAATVGFVPAERAVERRFFRPPARVIPPVPGTTPHVYVVGGPS